MNKLIGISGHVGSGKDTAANIIQWLDSKYLQNDVPTYQSFIDLCKQYGSPGIHSYWENNYKNFYHMKKFGTKVKQIISIITGIPARDLEKIEVKNSYLPDYWNKNGVRMTVREMLQKIGTDAIRDIVHPDTWVNALFSEYNEDSKWVIADLRYTNELERIKKEGGIVIRLHRNNNLLPDSFQQGSQHSSETELDNYQDFDFEYQNDGSLEDLYSFLKNNII